MPNRSHYLTIFLISMSLLILEIAVARILSVALFSHYAFVAISLAMFGLGLSGLVVYLLPAYFTRARLDHHLVLYSSLFGLTAAVGMLAYLHIAVVQELSIQGFLTLSLIYSILMVPFFCGGLCVSLLMTHFSADIGRIYFADLLGASLGCLAVVVAMDFVAAPWLPLLVGVTVSALSLLLALTTHGTRPIIPGLVTLVLAVLVAVAATTDVFTMRYVKSWSIRYAAHEMWNAFSRVSAFDWDKNAAQVLPLPRPANEFDDADYPATMMLDIDGAAWTPMMQFDGNFESVQFLRDSVLYAGYHLRRNADVLIIGIGGGRDVLAARAFNERFIQGIELNPLMSEIVNDVYGEYSGRPYFLDGVDVIIDEARSRLHRLDRRFDIIQLSLIDTFSLNAAGGFVFTENNLYTTEGFRNYYRHLKDDGILSLTRYFVPAYPLEILRLVALTRQAWADEGIPSIADRIVILHQRINATVLAKRSPFTAAELATIDRIARENDFKIIYRPGSGGGNPAIESLVTTADIDGYLERYPYQIAPPTDDWPFFFNFLRGRLDRVPGPKEDPFQFLRLWHESLSLMYLLIAVVTTLATVFFFGPLLLLAHRGAAGVPLRVAIPGLLYFACLGYGFIMIEIPLLQRLMLLLGYPVYALAVVLFALLLFSGIGSLLSTRIVGTDGNSLARVLVAVVVVGLVYAWMVPAFVSALLPLSLWLKIIATVLVLGPIGLLLGTAYPLGIGLLREISEGLVPWAWGLNGVMSVVASVLATFIGSRVGFTGALLTGITAYGLALACIVIVKRTRSVALADG